MERLTEVGEVLDECLGFGRVMMATEEHATAPNVLDSGQLGVEPDTELDHRPDRPPHLDRSTRRPADPGDHPQQGRLACAVRTGTMPTASPSATSRSTVERSHGLGRSAHEVSQHQPPPPDFDPFRTAFANRRAPDARRRSHGHRMRPRCRRIGLTPSSGPLHRHCSGPRIHRRSVAGVPPRIGSRRDGIADHRRTTPGRPDPGRPPVPEGCRTRCRRRAGTSTWSPSERGSCQSFSKTVSSPPWSGRWSTTK